MPRWLQALVWALVSLIGAGAFATLALSRGETISAAWLLTAAVCTYAVGYRFYSKILAAKVFALDATRATPAERRADGRDFVPTNKWIVFGHHFAAIAGPGPLVGPTLAAGSEVEAEAAEAAAAAAAAARIVTQSVRSSCRIGSRLRAADGV